MPTLNYENVGALVEYDYLQGTITALYSDDDTADVTLKYKEDGEDKEDELTGVPIFYHCEDDAIVRDNGAIIGAAAGFSVTDIVIILIGRNNADTLGQMYYIIGHYDEIRRCSNDIILISFKGVGVSGTQYILWNVATNDFAKIPLNNVSVDGEIQYIIGKFGLYYNEIDLTSISDWLDTVTKGYSLKFTVDPSDSKKYSMDKEFGVRPGWFMYPAGYPEYWSMVKDVGDSFIRLDQEIDPIIRLREDMSFYVSPSMPLYKKTKKASPARFQEGDYTKETSFNNTCDVTTLVEQTPDGVCTCLNLPEPRGPHGSESIYETGSWGGFDYLQGFYLDASPIYPVRYNIPVAKGYYNYRYDHVWDDCNGGEIYALIFEGGSIRTTNYSFLPGPIYEEYVAMNVSGRRPQILSLPGRREIIYDMASESEDFGRTSRIIGPGHTACKTGCAGGTAYPGDQFQNYDSAMEIRYLYTNIETPLGEVYPAVGNVYTLKRTQDMNYIAPTWSSIEAEYHAPWHLPDMDYLQTGSGLAFSGCSLFSVNTMFQIYAAEMYVDGLKYYGDVLVQCENRQNTFDIDPFAVPRNEKLKAAIGKAHSVTAALYVVKQRSE